MGYIPWVADTAKTVFVKCYYSKNAAETILSPTDIVATHITDIHAWGQHCNLDTGQGWIKLYYRNGDHPITYTMTNINNLWYHINSSSQYDDYHCSLHHTQPLVRRLNQAAQYELFHQRFGHPGQRAMSLLHKFVAHVPPLKGSPCYKCASCAHAKSTRRTHEPPSACSITTPQASAAPNPLSQPTAACGQHFAIDFGFMKGGEFVLQDKEGRTITSIDGYRSYCIIVNRASRYTWVFLTKTKHPPVDLITKFLEQHGNKQVARRTIRTDEGGELWNSALFRDAVYNQGYNLEPTAAGAPSQNGLAERPNQTFGNMVRCLLFSAALGPEFWSFALLHAVYLKNRLPHTALNDTPYKVYTGQ
jgi:hypothetical protein